jgi:ABC-type Fe3+-hydroxamate transport system substrate-binding protein
MMLQAGFTNMYADQKRYPSIDLSTINQDEVDVILLSSEPFPFKEKHKKILQRHFPKTTILLVAGEPFTWFGAYPLEGFSYLSTVQKLISNAH